MNELAIKTTDSEFLKVSSDLSKLFKENQVSLFAGAGVSIPSGIPGSNILVKSITSSMLNSLQKLSLGTIHDHKLIKCTISELRLETILDSIVQFHENSILNLLLNFRFAKPNFNHLSVASLAKRGYLSNIITLNFDILFELSLDEIKIPFTWKVPLAGVSEAFTHADSHVSVIKPHGTLPWKTKPYKDYYLAATLEYAGDHPQFENTKTINSAACESPVLVVCGYANHDWDIFPILKASPWKIIYWIQHSNETPPSVISWLQSKENNSCWILHGDVRLLFKEVLEQLKIPHSGPIGKNIKIVKPDVSLLDKKIAATAFAAINLLNARENEIYRSLLYQLGRCNQIHDDFKLMQSWERAMCWVHHSHEGKPRKAIHRYRLVIPSNSQLPNNHIGRLNDCRSMHYEHISALKRPYFNPLFLRDIVKASTWRRELLNRVSSIESSHESDLFIKKKAIHIKAIIEYDLIDLRHNWAYHLLLFLNKSSKCMFTKVFRQIAHEYDRLADKYPDMDWEYRLVRRVEAHLLANDDLTSRTLEKLMMVREMFEQTWQAGHLANANAIIAIANSNLEDFLKSKEQMTNLRGESTPSGRLRVVLLQRYFWHKQFSLLYTIKSIILKN